MPRLLIARRAAVLSAGTRTVRVVLRPTMAGDLSGSPTILDDE